MYSDDETGFAEEHPVSNTVRPVRIAKTVGMFLYGVSFCSRASRSGQKIYFVNPKTVFCHRQSWVVIYQYP